MKILDDFYKHKKRVALRTKTNNKKSRWEAQAQKQIEAWLIFCGREYRLERISQIRQDHYTAYMRHLSNKKGLSSATIYNYALTLQKFIDRASLQIKSNPCRAYKRRQEKDGQCA